jgi:hypothetical protein
MVTLSLVATVSYVVREKENDENTLQSHKNEEKDTDVMKS